MFLIMTSAEDEISENYEGLFEEGIFANKKLSTGAYSRGGLFECGGKIEGIRYWVIDLVRTQDNTISYPSLPLNAHFPMVRTY